MKRLYKRVLAAVLVCLALLANCTPFLSVAFATDVSSTLSVSFGDDWASGDNVDDLLSLAGLSYFASNGVNMVSYNQTGETLVDTYMRYYKQFYEEQIVQAGATSDFYAWIANSITENALGIRRVAGAVTGAAKILIGEPLAQILNPFLNWFNNKFNSSGSTTEQTVEITRDTAVAAVTVSLADGSPFVLSINRDGSLLSDLSYVSYGDEVTVLTGASVSTYSISFLSGYTLYVSLFRSNGGSLLLRSYFRLTGSGSDVFTTSNLSFSSSLVPTTFYLAAFTSGVYLFYTYENASNQVIKSTFRFNTSSGAIPYSYFYSSSEQFAGSGVSVLTTSVSSDGSLSYGPDTTAR